MANEIKLVTYANSEVTPQNDAVLTNLEIASNGVIFGCNVTIKNASTLHINAGMGVVYGREFEIVDSDIPVSLSSSGTLLGQLYVHIDLANTSEPAQLLVDTGNSLTPLVDDPTINITTGSTDYQLATFTVDTSTLANLTETFSIVDNPTAIIGNTDISGIGDGTVTGAIDQLNTDLSNLKVPTINVGIEEIVGTLNGKNVYRKRYMADNVSITTDTILDSNIKYSANPTIGQVLSLTGSFKTLYSGIYFIVSQPFTYQSNMSVYCDISMNGLALRVNAYTVKGYFVEIIYTKAS
jgi:hypothetical protein